MLEPILPAAGPRLYFDDLHVGQRFTTAAHTMDAAEIVVFARIYDPQPFHLSDAGAATSIFGTLAASGWHTAAITMRLIVSTGPPIAGGIVGSGGELTWPLPTRPGDVLRVVCEVLEMVPSRSRPERGMVIMRNETLNQRNEVVQVFTPKLVVPRRPA